MINSYFILLVIGFSLFLGMNSAFADVTITTASGSGAPGCEDTSSGCFIPSTAKVNVSEKVIFSNTDGAAHTFTSGDPTMPDTVQVLFDSGLAMAGSTFEWSPIEVGDVPYFCMVHPWMQGLIIVSGSSTTTPTPTPPTLTPTQPTPIPSVSPTLFTSQYTPVDISTDKTSYYDGETIRVTGEVWQKNGYPITIIVKSPIGNKVKLDQLTVGTDKKFSMEFTSGGPLMKVKGTYIIDAQYGNANQVATTSFDFGGSTTPTPTPTPTPSESFPIGYVIAGIGIAVIVAVIVVVLSKRKKPAVKSTQSGKPQTFKPQTSGPDATQFWVCPHCGKDTEYRNQKQFCRSCNAYL